MLFKCKTQILFRFKKYSDLTELTKFTHSKYFLNNSYAFLFIYFFLIMEITTIIICVQNLSVRKYNNVKTTN